MKTRRWGPLAVLAMAAAGCVPAAVPPQSPRTPAVRTAAVPESAGEALGPAVHRAAPLPRRTPSAAPSRPRSAAPAVSHRTALRRAYGVTRITGYSYCGASAAAAQRCIDRGRLTLYYPGAPVLAGHDYMGWNWLDDLPVGRRVTVASGSVAGTYTVYGHLRLRHQGGAAPGFGSAALVLQTCSGPGTGFSLLHRTGG